MDLAPAIVRVRAAWKRRGYRRAVRNARLYVPPQWVDEITPELTEPAADAAQETAPVQASANGHGGKPGPLAKTEP